jgi:hypothetical protein
MNKFISKRNFSKMNLSEFMNDIKVLNYNKENIILKDLWEKNKHQILAIHFIRIFG